jgi:holo-[acyl-carrier protein] synthase
MAKVQNSIGIDLVEVSKIRASHKKFGSRFLAKVLSEQEIAYCRKKKNLYQSISARFAAKEAFKKALSNYWTAPISWQEVEVVVNKNKVPGLKLSSRLRKILRQRQVTLSLSHTENFAVAVVFISGIQKS